MSSAYGAPTMSVSWDAPSQVDTDLLVVPIFEQDDLRDLHGLDEGAGGQVRRALESGELTGKPFQIVHTALTAGGWKARRALLVGAGIAGEYSMDRARKLAAAAGIVAKQSRCGRIAVLHRGSVPAADVAQALAEGLVLADFEVGSYKTRDRDGAALTRLQLVVPGGKDAAIERAAQRGVVLGHASNLARGLANEPGNVLTPRAFADRAVEIVSGGALRIDVLDELEIERLKMGLLLGVARGSAEPPRLLVIRHDPPAAPAAPVLGLVGKGITFDSGGISIKPADGMDRMKDDMSGGAAVICAMRAIATLAAPIRVVAIVPTTENMPGGRALKPGDILTGASGTTVEVVNTDAEGRLVLGDALWYARQLGATHVVDIATLTGACVVALGKITSGLFGTPAAWVELIRRTAERAGDRCWPLPLFDEYGDQIRSDIADLINSGGRPAGAVTAAMFLKNFAGEGPWAHLDIAGTAWAEEARPFQPKGPTGVGVRTLAELAFTNWGEWGK